MFLCKICNKSVGVEFYEFHYGFTSTSARMPLQYGKITTTGITFSIETSKFPLCNSCISKKVKRNNFLYSIPKNIYLILFISIPIVTLGAFFFEDFFQILILLILFPLSIVLLTVGFPKEMTDMAKMGSSIAIVLSKKEFLEKGFDYLCTPSEYSKFLIVPAFSDINEMENTKSVGKLIDTIYQFGFPSDKNYSSTIANMVCDSLGRIGIKKDIELLESLKRQISIASSMKSMFSPETIKFIDNAIYSINKRESS